MDYFDCIQTRFSVRGYKSNEVEQKKLDKILEAGRLAPTACNLQAFKILVIPTEKYEEQLKVIYSGSFFTQAPLVLGIFADYDAAWVRGDGKNYAYVDAAIVMDHMILAAAAQNLGTCWIGAFDTAAARKFADLGPQWEPVAFTPLGYTERTPRQKTRKRLDELVHYL
ncbi:nitroreductase family protein [Marispirochaeta sp.]|uniref:nitroreductase family protein n=1 Tax=Marispirochaeta sp. TaxID=2038653 RepID=UPI0029C88991|nr:nitroreductase family protein [Marispirochaeta sp.]